MLLILGMNMKLSDGYSRQTKYNKTTSILIAAQTWRIVGIVFLLGVGQGIIPPAFGIPAGVGDILIGATAIPMAFVFRKGYPWSRDAVVVWSVLGVADLAMAISLGLITGQEQLAATGTATMQTLPWILIPAAAVPASLTLHGIALYRLRHWAPMQH
jgi:hypothetical protein